MKTKLTLTILSLATCALIAVAQENNPAPADPAPPPPAEKPGEQKPDPADPKPADTNPAESKPGDPKPAEAKPAEPAPGDANPVPSPAPTPAPAEPAPAPTQPLPAPVEPAQPVIGPVQPAAPVQAAPVQTAPVQPAPVQPAAQPSPVPAEAAGAAPGDAAAPASDVVPLIVIEDVPLTDAIRNLARQSNLNFQFDPRLTAAGTDGKGTNQPNVSIRFENVTAQEALNAVLDNYNLALIKDPKSKIARVTVRDPKAEDPLVSRIIQLRYSDPTNIVNLLKATLSPRSSVVADTRTSQLIVTTTEKELDNVNAVVTKLDTATKQVLIEARLLETTKTPSSIKGIDWSGTLEAQRFVFGNGTPDYSVPQNAVVSGFNNPQSVTYGQGIFAGAGGIIANTARGFHPATAFLNADGVSAVLSYLNKDSDTEVVAMPRAVTLDNLPATLSVTRAFPIFMVTPGSANSPAGAQVNYTNLGTILNVTPRIAADRNISMKIVPEVSNIDSVDRQTINGQANTANIYAIRRITTHVMIPSGNTLVMGGMMNDSTTKAYTKVPLLGDLPGIGLAFRRDSKKRNKSNLLIFITPTIVEEGDFHTSSSGSEFLKTRLAERPEPKESFWDSGKPKDWSKPRR